MTSSSSVKMAMDTRGYWKPGDSREFAALTKFLDYGETQLKKDILDIKPIQDWFCGVVCVSKVKNLEHGNDLIDWITPEYLFINTKAYELPMDINRIVSDIFDLSLSHRILGVNPRSATIYVEESEDGTTNITDEIVGLLFEVFKRPIKTLSEELNVMRKDNDDRSQPGQMA